jgi:gliding motility-associated protein GldM
MAGYKETPRQKMIGMMYLVLTALLALNVSKQILDAFVVVNESMETTNSNFSKKLESTYSKFEAQYQLSPNKVKPYWEKAMYARKISGQLEKYVDSIKYVVIMRTDKLGSFEEAKKLELRNAKRKDNYDYPTRYFIGSSNDGSAGEARILKEKIEAFKKQMLELVDPKYRSTIKIGMDTEGPFYDADGTKQNWEMHNFYRTILAATVTILNKIKAEIYNAEFDVVNSIYSSVSAEDFKFNVIKARVVPQSRFVFAGEEYKAEILVAAYDSTNNPKVKYIFGADTITAANEGSAKTLEGSGGVVWLNIPAGGSGLQRYAGYIQVMDPSGSPKNYYFSEEYIVGKRSISISPTQMLVFYRGIPNPVKIAVPGGATDIQAVISFGTIARSDTSWTVSIPATGGPNRVTISVSAVYGGKRIPLGSEEFRLKTIPDPDVTIAGQPDGLIQKNLIINAPDLICAPPPGFDLKATYRVISYTFGTTSSTGDYTEVPGQGRTLSQEVLRSILNSKRKQKIWFDNIKVQGPDGTRKVQKSLSYTIL